MREKERDSKSESSKNSFYKISILFMVQTNEEHLPSSHWASSIFQFKILEIWHQK